MSFGRVFKAVDFANQRTDVQGRSTVCFKRLIFQPIPLILFTWDGWWQEMKCSFVGPSSLFQRWNLQLRSNYNLLVRNSYGTFIPYSNCTIHFIILHSTQILSRQKRLCKFC